MGPSHAGLLFLLFSSVFSFQPRSGAREAAYAQDPESQWKTMTEADDEETDAPAPKPKLGRSSSGTPQARKYPEFVIVSEDQTALFKPEKGVRTLPESVKKQLLDPQGTKLPAGGSDKSKTVEVLCHVDRMYVRVKRDLFKTRDAYKYLKLGNCPVNKADKDYYYLLYLLDFNCGFKKKSNRDFLFISIGLSYDPTTPVVREMLFDITLQCKFPRFFHSFKVGFYPKLQGGTVYRQLRSKNTFALVPQDASWNDITGSRTYTLGQPMHFQASGPDGSSGSGNRRLYIHKCYMTTSQNPSSNPKYTVIDNQGCMIDGKLTAASQFIKSGSKRIQRFRVAAFVFKKSASAPSSQLYMHCQIAFGPLTPTQSFKACTYFHEDKKWKELYGSSSVCSCCESTCPSAQPRASKAVISTQSWKVGMGRSGGEDYVEIDPPAKSADDDSLPKEDLDEKDHDDYLKYWDDEY